MGEIKTRYKKFLLKKIRLRNEKLIRRLNFIKFNRIIWIKTFW
jgi:hypothetical protein